MKKTTDKKKKISLLNLQREYLEATMLKIDQMIALADNLGTIDDPLVLEVYNEQINQFEKEADESYRIACDIEKVIKR